MLGVRIVTDSACDIPREMVKRHQITVVPLVVVFGQEEYADWALPPEEFWEKAAQAHPQSSQPSPGAFAEAYRPLVEAGHDVLCVTLTSKHSGTFNSAVAAARGFPQGRITVFDSLSLSLGQGVQVLSAARMAEEGASVEDIVAHLTEMRARIHIGILLDTLEYLERGGRAAALMPVVKRVARALNIKPILNLVDGELKLLAAARSYGKGQRRLVDDAAAWAPLETAAVVHARAPDVAEALARDLAEKSGFPEEAVLVAETGAVLSSHGGPRVVGVIALPRER